MALPAISDSFDAFELLGLDRTEVGQVGAVIDSFVWLVTLAFDWSVLLV